MAVNSSLSNLPPEEMRAWATIGQSGICVHSFFAPRRGKPCAGCMVRESQRALGMLLDVLEHGVTSPAHGLEFEDRDDAIRKPRFLYEMVEEARS